MAFQYYPNYYPQMQTAPQMQQPAPSSQTQTSGFVSVRSEAEARNYPVAYGNSVTFKDENAPYIYTKTMGFSQLDRPIFDKYKLVKEQVKEEVVAASANALDPKISDLEAEIGRLWQAIDDIKRNESEVDEGV